MVLRGLVFVHFSHRIKVFFFCKSYLCVTIQPKRKLAFLFLSIHPVWSADVQTVSSRNIQVTSHEDLRLLGSFSQYFDVLGALMNAELTACEQSLGKQF
jgi:hypothetical protein